MRSFHNIDESDKLLFDDTLSAVEGRQRPLGEPPGFEPAGPRRKIFFDPSKTRAAVVTCGGLCPGVNDVIRGLTMELHYHYGVRKVYGFCDGYQGFVAKYGRQVLDLTPEFVSHINEQGGTILGTSRGQQDAGEIVDCLERMDLGFQRLVEINQPLIAQREICLLAGRQDIALQID